MPRSSIKPHHVEDHFRSKDGLLLFYQSWIPRVEPHAAIVIVHDYAEHSSRYEWLAQHLVNEGYIIYAYDLRGHGKSEGLRAYLPSSKHLMDDLGIFVERIRRRKRTPIFLLGQSMSGGVLVNYVVTRKPDIAGLILSSASLRIKDMPPASIRFLVPLASALLPTLCTAENLLKLSPCEKTHRQSSRHEYENDPFVYHGKMPNRTGWVLDKAMRQAMRNAKNLTKPLLILHGRGNDKLSDPKGSQEFHERATSKDKTFRFFSESFPNLFQDREREKVARTLLRWLKQRVV